MLVALTSIAHAASGDAASDPLGLASQLYQFIITGKGTAAAGIAMLFVVWGLRNGLGAAWLWWKTPIGGYVLGFSIPAILYLGTATASGNAFTFGLFVNAAGAGWVAAGGWEHFRDLIMRMRNPPALKKVSAGLAVSLIIVLGGFTCGTQTPTAGQVEQNLIDCTTGDLGGIASLFHKIKDHYFPPAGAAPTASDWAAIEQEAIDAGKTIGGCALVEIVQEFLGGKKALTVGQSQPARGALEDFRAKQAKGAVFHTPQGNL